MDRIELVNVGKKFRKRWIFRGINTSFSPHGHTAIVGSNGSGKSTLLQIISSFMLPGEGQLKYFSDSKEIPSAEVYQHMSIATPYMELIEEFTLEEVLTFHQRIKGFKDHMAPADIIGIMGFEAQRKKLVKNFSSGMKQRLKLALAFYSDTSLLMLDEPTSNLDSKGIDWYQEQLTAHRENRIVLVCSNHKPEDLFSCTDQLNVEDFA